ncbi:MAG: chromosome segregation SMC family protein [Candidatus Pacearchaeota archaeon]
MVYIKKLVLHGFKSFARKTEILFENSMNVIIGPNGSGKSNIADAICFALGRMGKKSMRAENLASFIFEGNKNYKQSEEASVEIIFEDKENIFLTNRLEVSIKRIVKRNGNSIYKLNDEPKTRQEIIEVLARAGIDPDGFNIVLQGEIDSLIKVSSEERRKIIEEVAGISFYEVRKEKSLRELEKVEERLKETNAILREKNNYLKNLEEERRKALEFKKIEESIKKHKATILYKEIEERERELKLLAEEKEKNVKKVNSIKEKINGIKIEISFCEEKVKNITKEIEEKTSGEQDLIHKKISDLKAEIAALNVRKENFDNRIKQNNLKIENLKNRIKFLEKEISSFSEISPELKKQKEKKEELENLITSLEKSRRDYYILKSKINFLENKKEEKIKKLRELENEQKNINDYLNKIFSELRFSKSLDSANQKKKEIILSVEDKKQKIEEIQNKILLIEREDAILEQNIKKDKKLIENISSLEICPLCKSKITEDHKKNLLDEAKDKISFSEKKMKDNLNMKKEILRNLEDIRKKIIDEEKMLKEIEIEENKIKYAEEKKERIKKIFLEEQELKKILKEVEEDISKSLIEYKKLEDVEEKYEEARLRLKEISFDELDYDSGLLDKKREIERLKIEISNNERDSQETNLDFFKIKEKLSEKEKELKKLEEIEKEIFERFNTLYLERNEFSDKQKALETNLIGLQQQMKELDEKNNFIRLKEAELGARLEAYKEEFSSFLGVELISGSKEHLQKNLFILQEKLKNFESVNMKSLDIYEKVKIACQEIEEKLNTIIKEKEKILEVISEIDKKKKRTFLKTLEQINNFFSRNFSQLSSKGEIFLDIENKEDPFAGGLEIILKVGKGKYFDIYSLSGGEKTLVALSLIFAIQEYRPYCFYIFDEIDAALDKHNSELLASLIKRYLVSGQYIIITHNDALIEHAPILYGVSMQEGVSKIVSQKF